MKSPKDMRIIEIDITNACIFRCSNCTRFCGHHKKPFFMNFETFKRAVDSMEGYVGCVSLIGGEPTLHPEFDRFAKYLASKYEKNDENELLYPQANFMNAIKNLELKNTFAYDGGGGERQTVNGPCLFSVMGDSYRKHYEVIQDTFKYQGLNDHSNDMYHQAALISRKELGIRDDEWVELRDKCWIQNEWSASITPKGAFFCEVAGTLDMLFKGPGGWPIEPGWWKREPDEFGEQLKWCEYCGFACHTFSRNANEEVDDVSPVLFEKLKVVNSPRINQPDHINIVEIQNGSIQDQSIAYDSKWYGNAMPYAKRYEDKFGGTLSALYPGSIVKIWFLNNGFTDGELKRIAERCYSDENAYRIVFSDYEIRKRWDTIGLIDDSKVINESGILFGNVLNSVLDTVSDTDFVVIITGGMELPSEFEKQLQHSILNPGVLLTSHINSGDEVLDSGILGYDKEKQRLVILNKTASSIRELGYDRISQLVNIDDLIGKWKKEKVIEINEDLFYSPPNREIIEGLRYVMFGYGHRAKEMKSAIQKGNGYLVAIVDNDIKKQGMKVNDIIIQPIEYFSMNKEEYDQILISTTYKYYPELRKMLLEQGFKDKNITFLGY